MSKEEERQDFACGWAGFHLKFTNGNTVSVQWGQSNYCDEGSAEIAAWDRKDRWHQFPEGNKVKGWVPSDEVAEFTSWVASNELNIGEKKRSSGADRGTSTKN
tara:strand:+ start:566 stop:874 length:309 start_codon:yes stop_codon:yes gene_type:complete